MFRVLKAGRGVGSNRESGRYEKVDRKFNEILRKVKNPLSLKISI